MHKSHPPAHRRLSLVAAIVVAFAGFSASASVKPLDLVKTVRSVSVTTEIAHDLSRPVRSMKHASATRKDDNPVSEAIDGAGKGKPMVHDTDFVSEVVPQHFRRLAQPVGPGVVSVDTSLPSAALPVPTKTCNGTGGNGDGVPPDPQLAVGTTQVLEAVNSRFTIFPKSGCANDQPGTTFATFFSGFPGPGCNASASYSDPVVLWDVAAQRWLMEIIDTTNSDLCMAVSATSDATGAWHRYGFLDPVGGDLPDYTKMGVWGDAYYSSTDEFIGETGYEGPSFCAYDRSAMVTGATATRQCFTPANNSGLTSSYIAAMPSTIDGPNLPPAGEPEWFVSLTLPNVQGVSNALAYWKMHVDWTTPANSTLSGPTNLSVTGYTPACSMNQSPTSTCVPTAPPGVPLDGLGQYAMFRLAYRNFGDHESMVISHSVDTGIARNQTETQVGERWYELRPSGSALSVFQQGTFSPDTTTYRWMGSIAQDHSGNMALGYSVSSSSIVPGVRYTGRLATDPLGTMNAGEVSVYQPTSGGQFLDRWGDYTEMSVDPTDDCTFWYVGEAIDDGFVGTGPYTTPIAAFKFPSCTAGGSDFSIGASPSSLTVQQGAAGTVNVSTTITAGSADAVTLSASGMPSGVTASFSPASINSGQSSTLTLTASSTATLGTAPVTITGTGTAHTHTASVSLTVSSTGDDFSMSASPTSVTVAPGGSAPVAISTAVTNGAAQSIALSASGLPSGVSAAFAPATISAGQSSTLTLTATSGAPATLTGITVTGTGASATHSVMVNVTVTSPPPSIPFTPNTSMFPNSLNQAFLVQKDSEPTMATAEDGSIYINAPIGGGGGCHVWSVDRPGPTPHYLGQSDGGYGGADCDVATSRTKDTALNPAKDLVAAASLAVQAAQIHTSASFDAGNTWVQNPNGTQTPADDRMWLSAGQKDKPDEFFMTYRQAPGTGFLIVMKSEDGGLTYTTTGPPINNVGTPTSNFTSWEGNIVVDPNDSNNVYVVFMGSPANNHATATEAQVIWLGSSHDGGVSWQESVVHDGGAGKAYGSIFPSLTMDTSGRLWATYTDGVDMFVARSPGVSPAPEGAWTQITLPRPTLDGRPVVHTAFPWITSSVPGQVDVAWLGSNDAVSNANSNWGLFFARLINGSVSTVEKANTSDFHHGWVCVSGSGCGNVGTDGVSTSGDRRMGDFITIRDDSEGLAHIAFTHDPDCPCGGTNQPDGRGSYIQYVREKPTQLDHIKVSPASATITTDGAQAYTVEGLNKYGDSLGDVTSSASFSISGGGTCTGASCTAGTPGTYTVTANVGGKLATASLQVNPGALAHVVLSPATASIVAGGSQAYTATGSDAHNNSLGDVTGSTVFTVTNGTCTTNSCSSTLAGAQTVTGNDNGVIGTAALTVTPGSLASMSLSPANNSAIVGTDVTYTATGFDAYGNTIGNVTPATTFTILPDGGCAANKCHANSTGNHTVTGKNGAVVATATLIGVVGTVDHIVVSPASATIAAGGQQAYVADAYDAGGNFLGDMTGSAAFTISPNGTCSGNQCGSTKAGAHTVTGNVAGALGTASLTVVAGPASQIALSPKDSRTVVGGSQVYTVASSDQYGNSTGDVTSSAILTISPEGSCTGAQCTAAATGPHTVGAAVGTMTAQATLHVVPAAPTITSPAAGSRGGSPVTVAGTAPAGSTVRVVDEGHNVVASNLPVTGGTWSTQVEFASGVHTITAFALQSGELSDASAARTFTVDATGPTVSINRPGGYLLFGLYPGVTNVHGMARDNTAVTSITTTYTNLLTGDVVHSSYLHCATCPAASVQWDDQPSLGPGLWEVSAVAVDEVGNVSTPDVMDFITLG